jgi:tRNA (mo5U34)-methyltransferase
VIARLQETERWSAQSCAELREHLRGCGPLAAGACDVVLCFGVLHRVTDPIALLRALADLLAPGGEIVLETYGSRPAADAPAVEGHEPGDVYARDELVYWGFSPAGLGRLARIVGLGELEVVDQLEIDGHPRILAPLRAAG